MDRYLQMLGYEYTDRVTGFTGVADSVCFDLYGCVQVSLMPPALTGVKGSDQPNGRWFDTTRLQRTERERVMEIPTFDRIAPQAGPADKAPREA